MATQNAVKGSERVNITTTGNDQPTTVAAPWRMANPFTAMRRMMEDLDRAFEEWDFGRQWLSPLLGHEPLMKRVEGFGKPMFLPDIEVIETDNSVIVRADLPGIEKEDVHVEINDRSLVIKGERQRKEEEKKNGYYRSERVYGSFYRSIPLPDGVEARDAKANFKDGVLEVEMTVKKNGRKVEIA